MRSSLLSVRCRRRGGVSGPGTLTRRQCQTNHIWEPRAKPMHQNQALLPQKQSPALEPPRCEHSSSTPLGPQIFPVVLRTAKDKSLQYLCFSGNTALWPPTSENSKGIQSTQQKPKNAALLLWRVSISPLLHSQPVPPLLSI